MSCKSFSAPRELEAFHAISTPVGSGKTRAVVEYIASSRQNFLYVAPTVRLVDQTNCALQVRLQQSAAKNRRVSLIHSELDRAPGQSVFDHVLRSINDTSANAGHVVICTTPALLTVISRIRRPGDWGLLLDEAFAPVDFIELPLGLRKRTREGSMSAFLQLFDVVEAEGNRVISSAGQATLVREIGQHDWKQAGLQYKGFQPFANAVSNPALRVELVGCAKAAVEGQADPVVACYVTPEHFSRFREVLFMSALFERTVLYHLWTRLFGVRFAAHPTVNIDSPAIRDLHKEQGPFVSIGHLLHPSDNSSLSTLSRSCISGCETPVVGERVIDAMVKIAHEYFGNDHFLLQANTRFGYSAGSPLMPPSASSIPVVSHGLNAWDHVDNVAALAVTNPTPQQAKWVQERAGLTRAETLHSYRVHTQYQAVGRSSVRNRVQTDAPKTFLVPSKADADALVDIWRGSVSLGQIGSLPKMSAPKAPRAEAYAREMRIYLESLPPTVRKVSFRSLKALLSDPHEETWLSARDILVKTSPAWARAQQSLHRLP